MHRRWLNCVPCTHREKSDVCNFFLPHCRQCWRRRDLLMSVITKNHNMYTSSSRWARVRIRCIHSFGIAFCSSTLLFFCSLSIYFTQQCRLGELWHVSVLLPCCTAHLSHHQQTDISQTTLALLSFWLFIDLSLAIQIQSNWFGKVT